MTRHGATPTGLLVGLFLALAAATAIAALVVAVERVPAAPPTVAMDVDVGIVRPDAVPIDAEAGVFRTQPGMLAIGDPAIPRRHANPRTLQTFRVRRAFPGAPPRIPHGLTSREFQTNACNTCHQRGGYSPRFGAYVPVTPHPELGACLQCHVGNDATTGVILPGHDPNTICRQCHDPDAPRLAVPPMEWRMAVWPRLAPRSPGGAPPPIAHDLQLRGNCVACHTGPGAVAEIRTLHPERANCRQCHVTAEAGAETFTREAPAGVPDVPGVTP
ncbi:MAG: hypothetical protein AAB075_01695 [Gemmatimonadota bacterium]